MQGMSSGRGKEVLHDVLTKLLRYTERHFTAEEAVMKELSYPGLSAQIEQHRTFTNKIKEVADQYKAGTIGLVGRRAGLSDQVAVAAHCGRGQAV